MNPKDHIGKTIVAVSKRGNCLAHGTIVDIRYQRNTMSVESSFDLFFLVSEPGNGVIAWPAEDPQILIFDQLPNLAIGADLKHK